MTKESTIKDTGPVTIDLAPPIVLDVTFSTEPEDYLAVLHIHAETEVYELRMTPFTAGLLREQLNAARGWLDYCEPDQHEYDE